MNKYILSHFLSKELCYIDKIADQSSDLYKIKITLQIQLSAIHE